MINPSTEFKAENEVTTQADPNRRPPNRTCPIGPLIHGQTHPEIPNQDKNHPARNRARRSSQTDPNQGDPSRNAEITIRENTHRGQQMGTQSELSYQRAAIEQNTQHTDGLNQRSQPATIFSLAENPNRNPKRNPFRDEELLK